MSRTQSKGSRAQTHPNLWSPVWVGQTAVIPARGYKFGCGWCCPGVRLTCSNRAVQIPVVAQTWTHFRVKNKERVCWERAHIFCNCGGGVFAMNCFHTKTQWVRSGSHGVVENSPFDASSVRVSLSLSLLSAMFCCCNGNFCHREQNHIILMFLSEEDEIAYTDWGPQEMTHRNLWRRNASFKKLVVEVRNDRCRSSCPAPVNAQNPMSVLPIIGPSFAYLPRNARIHHSAFVRDFRPEASINFLLGTHCPDC